MLVGKDHAGGGRSLILQNYDVCTKNIVFLHRTDSHVSVRNKNRSKLYVRSPPTRFYMDVGVRKQANVEIIPKKHVKKHKAFRNFSPNRTTMALGEAQGGLGGLKLDEIDAANSFLMLPMARNGFKWPVISQLFLYVSIYFSI